jgi:hypothetical protein
MNRNQVRARVEREVVVGEDAAHGRSRFAVAWLERVVPHCEMSNAVGGEPRWFDGRIYAGRSCTTCGSEVWPWIETEELFGDEPVDPVEAIFEALVSMVVDQAWEETMLASEEAESELQQWVDNAYWAAGEILEAGFRLPSDWDADDVPDVWLEWLKDYSVGLGVRGRDRRLELDGDVLSMSTVDPLSLLVEPDAPDWLVASRRLSVEEGIG